MNGILFFTAQLYDLRSKFNLKRKKNTVHLGSESLSSVTPKIWELFPDTIKSGKSPSSFKIKVELRLPPPKNTYAESKKHTSDK